MLRWKQVYFLHLKRIFGILAGLRPEQTRETQHTIISRTVFLFFLTPRTPGQEPQTYNDLQFVRVQKVDIAHPSVQLFRQRMAELLHRSQEQRLHSSLDTLSAIAIAIYIPDLKHHERNNTASIVAFVINSIPKVKDLNLPCKVGYPKEVTLDMLQMMFKAHMEDELEKAEDKKRSGKVKNSK